MKRQKLSPAMLLICLNGAFPFEFTYTHEQNTLKREHKNAVHTQTERDAECALERPMGIQIQKLGRSRGRRKRIIK